MDSRANKLAMKGWLSLNDFCKYLSESHPQNSVSYPTALAMVREGKLRVITTGSTHRVYSQEIDRYLREGNYDPQQHKGADSELIKEADRVHHNTYVRPRMTLVTIAELPEEDEK